MSNIDTKVIEYHLCIEPKPKKIGQKPRSFSTEKYIMIT